jgi:hypothetical protein
MLIRVRGRHDVGGASAAPCTLVFPAAAVSNRIMKPRVHWLALASAVLALACGKSDAPGGSADATDGEASTGSTGIDTVSTSATTQSSADGSTGASASETDADSASDGDASASAGSDGGDGPTPTCDGTVYQCSDDMDNDDDGLVDLADPECTGPCDDDEGSFQTGIPGDNVDCFQDCFFDGNSGEGDDMCWWNITCDPANPGEGGMCEYVDSPMCNMPPPHDIQFCVDFCEPYTPPGCDCYGCCTVCTDTGCVDIWLGGADDCTLDNLEACTECTQQIDVCGNPCEPEACEVCFGETEPPEGCDEPGCENGLPCVDSGDCANNYYCLLGCCYPPPPG